MKNIKLFLGIIISIFILNVSIIYAEESDNSIYIKTEKIPENIQRHAEEYFKTMGQKDIERFTKNKYAKLKDIKLSKGIKIQRIENEDENENRYIFFILDKNNIISSITIIEYDKKIYDMLGVYELIDTLNTRAIKENNPITIIIGQGAIYSLDSNNKVEVLANDIYIDEKGIKEQLKAIEDEKEFYNNLETEVVEIKINTKSNEVIEKAISIRNKMLRKIMIKG